jgi:hypothetical protein
MRLSPDLHANLRLTPIDNAVLASKQRVIDLLVTDVQPLASRFPIVISALPALDLQALVTPSDTENLFAEHTPMAWRHIPLVLASMLRDDHPGQASTPGVRELSPAVVAALDAPHFQWEEGFRLFENGEPTPYLQGLIKTLEASAKDETRTHELVALLHRAGVLEATEVTHLGEVIECYLVNDKALSTNLDKVAKDGDNVGQAISLALAIADSQKGLKVERWTE